MSYLPPWFNYLYSTVSPPIPKVPQWLNHLIKVFLMFTIRRDRPLSSRMAKVLPLVTVTVRKKRVFCLLTRSQSLELQSPVKRLPKLLAKRPTSFRIPPLMVYSAWVILSPLVAERLLLSWIWLSKAQWNRFLHFTSIRKNS